MKYSIKACKCEDCPGKITAYTHNLNKSMVGALRQLVDFHEKNRRAANLQKDLTLTKNQYNNFQKLQYFGLARRLEHGWTPESLGIDFIYGGGVVMVPAATLGGEVLLPWHEAWNFHKRERRSVTIHDIDQLSYKQRPEYAQEKANSLF